MILIALLKKNVTWVFSTVFSQASVQKLLCLLKATMTCKSSGNEDHGHGEIAICSLGAIVICNIKSEEQYRSVAYYGMKMIDKCIDMSDYPFPHVAMTSKARRSAGLGMMGVATELARKGLKYSTQEGKDFFHEISERHAYYFY